MRIGVLATMLCCLAVASLLGCGESEPGERKTEFAACEPSAPLAYWYPVGVVADPIRVSGASAKVRRAFASTVDQRPKVGLEVSDQGSPSEDRWIVLKERDDSVFFGGLATDGQVTRWFNAVRSQGRWRKARLSGCEMLRVVKNGQPGPIIDFSDGDQRTTGSELTLTISESHVGCDYERPQVETVESTSSVTVTARFLRRDPSEEVICAAMFEVREKIVSAQLDRPLGDRQVFDGSFVPERLVVAKER